MARINNLSNFLTDVATAIKNKKGSETPIPAANFDTEITNLPSQGVYQHKTATIVENGTVTILPDTGYDAIDQLDVTVTVPLQQKTYTFTQNTTTTVTPDQGYAGFSQVNLEIDVQGETPEPTTATVDDVISPKTFYSNGQKLTGNITGHRTPLGETLDINSSFVETISNYDTCINNQNIVCKYNSSGYITFYEADTDNQTLTLLYTTELSGVYFTMSDCYYGSTNNEYDILLVTKNKSDDTTKGQTFKTYVLKVRNTITFEALTEKDLVISDYYYGRLYSTMSNGIWYVFPAYSSYNTSSSAEAYCMYRIFQADYSFNGTLNYITKSNSSVYTGRIATQYCYLTGMNISTLENGTHLVTASSRSNSGYSNLMRVAASVFSSDFSTRLYSSGYNVFWPSSGNAYYGGICAIGKYVVSMYTTDSNSNVYTVRVHEFASNTLTLKSTQTITIPTDLIGGAPNSPAIFHVLGSYGVCLFKRNLYYGFTFTVNNSGAFIIGENLMNGGSEYETFAVRNQNSNSFLDLKTWSIRVNSDGQRLDYLNVGNKTLYNTDDTNASAENILNSKIAYGSSGKITGTMPNNGALNYTPTTSLQSIPAGYTSGGTISAVTSAIDSNIRAENIKSGVTILGTEGTYDGPGYDPNLVLDSLDAGGAEQYLGGTPITDISNVGGFDVFNANESSILYYVMKTVTVTSNMTGFSMNNIKVLDNGVIQWIPYGSNTVFDTDDYLECTITCTDAYNNTETDVIIIYNSEEEPDYPGPDDPGPDDPELDDPGEI